MSEQLRFKDPLIIVSASPKQVEEFFLESHGPGEDAPKLEMKLEAIGLFAGILQKRKLCGLEGMWPSYDDTNSPSNEDDWVIPDEDSVTAYYTPETEMDIAFYLGKRSKGGYKRLEIEHGGGSIALRGEIEIAGEEEFADSIRTGAQFRLEDMDVKGLDLRRADRSQPESPYVSRAINLGRIIEPALTTPL